MLGVLGLNWYENLDRMQVRPGDQPGYPKDTIESFAGHSSMGLLCPPAFGILINQRPTIWIPKNTRQATKKSIVYSDVPRTHTHTPNHLISSHYKACTKYFPVLLRTTKLAQSTSQYYFVLQSLHKVLPSTTLYYKACRRLRRTFQNHNFTTVFDDRTSFRAKGLHFVASRWHCHAP